MESLVALDRRTTVMRWRDVRDESSLSGDLRPELAGAVSVILHATGEVLWFVRGAAPRSRLRTSSVTHAACRPVWLGRRLRLLHHHLRRNTALRPTPLRNTARIRWPVCAPLPAVWWSSHPLGYRGSTTARAHST